MSHDFTHPALNLQVDKPLVYTAMSKHLIVETTKDKIDMETEVANMRHLL